MHTCSLWYIRFCGYIFSICPLVKVWGRRYLSVFLREESYEVCDVEICSVVKIWGLVFGSRSCSVVKIWGLVFGSRSCLKKDTTLAHLSPVCETRAQVLEALTLQPVLWLTNRLVPSFYTPSGKMPVLAYMVPVGKFPLLEGNPQILKDTKNYAKVTQPKN